MKTSQVADAVPLVMLLSILMRQTRSGEAHTVNDVSFIFGPHGGYTLPIAAWLVRLTTHIANTSCLSMRRDRSPSTSVDC